MLLFIGVSDQTVIIEEKQSETEEEFVNIEDNTPKRNIDTKSLIEHMLNYNVKQEQTTVSVKVHIYVCGYI